MVQRRFRGFGDQWNFALRGLPITAPWTMKLDPDERLSEDLKINLIGATDRDDLVGVVMERRLWFMGRPLSVCQDVVRMWRTGRARFTAVAVNEHPLVDGNVVHIAGSLQHHDSPDLHHWIDKQNRYTTAEAVMAYRDDAMAERPALMGSRLQQRMWVKRNFRYLPFRFQWFFLYNWIVAGAWRAGWVGYAWARLRSDYMRFIEYKRREMEITGRIPAEQFCGPGQPDPRVEQFE